MVEVVIESGYMLLWKLVNDDVEFFNDCCLMWEEKIKFKCWIDVGVLEGDGLVFVLLKFFDGWMFGELDLVVKMNGEFEVFVVGFDIYWFFVFLL